jgi:hypothetical protein
MFGLRFGRKLKLPATAQIKQELRRMQFADELTAAANIGQCETAADFRAKAVLIAEDTAMRTEVERASLDLTQKGLNAVAEWLDSKQRSAPPR